MAGKIGIAQNAFWYEPHGILFDPRGVAETMRTIDLTNRKPASFESNKQIAGRLGRDSDGAFRIRNRLDGRA